MTRLTNKRYKKKRDQNKQMVWFHGPILYNILNNMAAEPDFNRRWAQINPLFFNIHIAFQWNLMSSAAFI